jgi:hypothetical protein
MGGGILQLVAYGAQDLYITGNPQITFFKLVHRRHTNFAIESVEQPFDGGINFGKRATCSIAKNGDLIHRVWLRCTLPSIPSCATSATPTDDELNSMAWWISNVGHSLIKNVELVIGGQLVDKQYGEWLHITNELSNSRANKESYSELIGSIDGITTAIKNRPILTDTYMSNYSVDNLGYGIVINGNNNTLKFTVDSVSKTATITPGVYTLSSLATEIKTRMDNASSLTFTVGYDTTNTNKLKFDKSGTTFTINGEDASCTIREVIGFNVASISAANSVTAPNEVKKTPIGSTSNGFKSIRDDLSNGKNVVDSREVYIPLQFWFCKHPGLSLPLIALQYHDVKIDVELNKITDLYYGYDGTVDGSGIGSLTNCSLWVDYIYLDTDERRRFAQSKHEYLIEQLQYNGEEKISISNPSIDLNLNHPIKELIWVVQRDSWIGNTTATGTGSTTRGKRWDKQWTTYEEYNTSVSGDDKLPIEYKYKGGKNPVLTSKLILNGHDRFSERDGMYFNMVQPYSHHTSVPSDKGINVYSFALQPEEHQPSGTCNFSKMDSATLRMTLVNSNPAKVRVYALGYNILRVMGGMGGVTYTN